MFHHNDTQAFMKKKFQAEDYKFIHKIVCENKEEEKTRRKEIVLHAEAKMARQAAAAEKRNTNAAATAERIARIKLILDREEVIKLKGKNLKDHLKAFLAAGAPNVKSISQNATVDATRQGLQKAANKYLAGKW